MILLARSRPHGDTHADAHEWTVEAAGYDAALVEAKAAVPRAGTASASRPSSPETHRSEPQPDP